MSAAYTHVYGHAAAYMLMQLYVCHLRLWSCMQSIPGYVDNAIYCIAMTTASSFHFKS